MEKPELEQILQFNSPRATNYDHHLHDINCVFEVFKLDSKFLYQCNRFMTSLYCKHTVAAEIIVVT